MYITKCILWSLSDNKAYLILPYVIFRILNAQSSFKDRIQRGFLFSNVLPDFKTGNQSLRSAKAYQRKCICVVTLAMEIEIN